MLHPLFVSFHISLTKHHVYKVLKKLTPWLLPNSTLLLMLLILLDTGDSRIADSLVYLTDALE